MPEFTLSFEAYCQVCGYHMCQLVDTDVSRTGRACIKITPCPKCLEEERTSGYDEGFSDGQAESEEASS